MIRGFLYHLIADHKQYFLQPYTTPEYILIVRTEENKGKTHLRLRTLIDITDDTPEATITTTLAPLSYVQKILEEEIKKYQRKGVKITKYRILEFPPAQNRKI